MVTRPDAHMVLTLFMAPSGYYKDSWRRADSRSEEADDFEFHVEIAKRCEAAKLDAVFYADTPDYELVREGGAGTKEPITYMAGLAARTERIGIIGTISTTFNEPYTVARQLAGIDKISGGRVGWNVVTSVLGNTNYGFDTMPPSAERYRRAREFVEVTTGLWDSWGDDAVINDRDSGRWLDPEKVRTLNHRGEFFAVEGPLNMSRSPQGRPVLVQAGQSPDGLDFGATIADAVYATQPEKAGALEYTRRYKELVASKGRDPRTVKILPGILPIVGETDAEAEEIARDLAAHINMAVARPKFAGTFKLNLDDVDLDERVPASLFPEIAAPGMARPMSRYLLFRKYALEDGYTLRELIAEEAKAGGHMWAVGSAATVADRMIDWFDSGACDGFNFNPPYMMGGLIAICDLLVPELQSRGYFRTEYEGTTLREHLGLARPAAWNAS